VDDAGGERGLQLWPAMAELLRHYRAALLLLPLPVCQWRSPHRRHVHRFPLCGHCLRHTRPSGCHRSRTGGAPPPLPGDLSPIGLRSLRSDAVGALQPGICTVVMALGSEIMQVHEIYVILLGSTHCRSKYMSCLIHGLPSLTKHCSQAIK